MERLHFAALMHDIGKLVVPNQLLNKPGKLTEDEFKRRAYSRRRLGTNAEPHRLPAPDRRPYPQRQHALRPR